MAAFALTSPSPAKATPPKEAPADTSEGLSTLPPEGDDFGDVVGLDSDFIKDIDVLTARTDLASIPTDFYTPGVPFIDNGDLAPEGQLSECRSLPQTYGAAKG